MGPRSGRHVRERHGVADASPRRPRVSWLGRLLSLLVVTTGISSSPAGRTLRRQPRRNAPRRVPSPGAAGLGDPYFPLLGNGGYEVLHYTIKLDLDIATGSILEAIAMIEATATQDLSAFNLDYRGPAIAAVAVDGSAATGARRRRAHGHSRHTAGGRQRLHVVVRYAGTPDGGADRFTRGWWATGTAIATVGEPAGADVWYPVNGHPLDKATYTLAITVPAPYDVVANGRLVSVT